MSTTENSFTYTTDVSCITLEAVADLYESVGFGSAEGYKEEQDFLKSIFGPGAYGFFAFTKKDHQLVGMVRVLSDDKICSWIAEICIHPNSQRKGVGSNLLNTVINRFNHTAIYLDAFAEETEFFTKHGITPKKKLIACSRAGQQISQEPEPFLH